MFKLSKIGHMALKDMGLKEKVAEACGVTVNTVYYWLRTDNVMLTTASVIYILSTETGLTHEQLLETKVQQAAA